MNLFDCESESEGTLEMLTGLCERIASSERSLVDRKLFQSILLKRMVRHIRWSSFQPVTA